MAAFASLRRATPLLLLCICLFASSTVGTLIPRAAPQKVVGEFPLWQEPSESTKTTPSTHTPSKVPDTLPALLDALDVLQKDYFAVWQGIWPTSIDWTSAVVGTYLSAALTTLSTSFPLLPTSSEDRYPTQENENRINRYFSQLVASYFGQDAFALRTEAYDDMLWVVLGWLESIKFIKFHSALHYKVREGDAPWYGNQWVPAFAHRARIFWDLASQGWDTSLCDGGMIWSPYLLPYKNAITNELYIAASISMYLYFPGDENSSPFKANAEGGNEPPGGPTGPHDPKYLAAAVAAYKWLNSSNMTDERGLYTDGFHISGLPNRPYKNDTHGNTKCDARNNMVFTYNQGVLLTGQRGLYEATSARSYLEDGHKLVRNVIAATGYDLKKDQAFEEVVHGDSEVKELPQWHGLGRAGILEDACDAGGSCSQDGQTFKGIFFHHLTSFCSQLPTHFTKAGEAFNVRQHQLDRDWHDATCKSYKSWVLRNARGALSTRRDSGRFGSWWGAPKSVSGLSLQTELPEGAVDYKNMDVPEDGIWKKGVDQEGELIESLLVEPSPNSEIGIRDLNDRGRGRTVETQGGGLSVLRAAWEWEGRI
ncbi:six-hairpin glycosidase-1 [Coleophoma cylindrospora]|uniref:Six-hairpin glycosidase-1 n=1 Tax=Coleophoma cylindrospora TaxID=1849047 RepID=A0A3D8S8N5_9HELO|nr:six-hairpin glycosidase-1 [Coleophoma cylindrospora]